MCLVGCLRFARHCGEMYSRHLFSYGGLFVCIHVCSRIVLILIGLHVHRLWISLPIELGSKASKQITTKNKFVGFLCFIAADFIQSCHDRLKMKQISVNRSDLPAIKVSTAFTIRTCLEPEFLKGVLVQGRLQSLWKFPILSNILNLEWCLSNKISSPTVRHVYLPWWQRWRA